MTRICMLYAREYTVWDKCRITLKITPRTTKQYTKVCGCYLSNFFNSTLSLNGVWLGVDFENKNHKGTFF